MFPFGYGIETTVPTADETVDSVGQLTSRSGHPAGVVAGQPEVDAVPDVGELGVVVDLLGMQRDPGQEAERLAEILELEGPEQRLAACSSVQPSGASIAILLSYSSPISL